MIQYVLDVINMINIKTPSDILNYMDNIEYGYIGLNGEKHINSLKGFRKNYRTLSIEQILEYKIGTCIEQVLLMHELLNNLNIKNKMFCTRVYESGKINDDQDEHLHCFILYYNETGVHQIKHPNGERKGIYDFTDENNAIEEINKIYIEMSGGVSRPVTEYFDVKPGLSFKEFNDYINSLDIKKYNKF